RRLSRRCLALTRPMSFLPRDAMRKPTCVVTVLCPFAFALLPGATWAADRIEYNRDIRPILMENCFACHGADSAARKAGLRLDQRDDAVQAGAVTPGRPEKSALVERVFSDEASKRMPPRKTKKELTAAQKETLKR